MSISSTFAQKHHFVHFLPFFKKFEKFTDFSNIVERYSRQDFQKKFDGFPLAETIRNNFDFFSYRICTRSVLSQRILELAFSVSKKKTELDVR